MPQIKKHYPGKSAHEIFGKVDELMEHVAERFSLDYEKDHRARTGRVHKLGVTGSYSVGEGGPTPLHALPLAFSAVASRAFAAGVGERARVAGFDGRGMLGLADLELGGLPAAGASSPELLERDWTPALGLKLDEAGNPAPVQR